MKRLLTYKGIIRHFNKVFNLFNAKYFNSELPTTNFTIQPANKEYGKFVHDMNGFYRIDIGFNFKSQYIENVEVIILHAMIHEYCFLQGIKDTSREGQYHNKLFRNEARKRDLEVAYNNNTGWENTAPTLELVCFCYENGLEDIQIGNYDLTKADKGTASVRHGNSRKYVCPCCGNIARTTKDMKLICGDCMEEMLLA